MVAKNQSTPERAMTGQQRAKENLLDNIQSSFLLHDCGEES
jgi:hypothetical protein